MKLFIYLGFLLVLLAGNIPSCSSKRMPDTPGTNLMKGSPQLYISYLPDEVEEGSGLLGMDGLLWTFNDSGGEPVLFGLHPRTGKVLRKVWLEGAGNRDWEAITADSAFVYVGDFGNNSGARNDLVIYRFSRSDMGGKPEVTVPVEEIRFFYEDQQRRREVIPDRRFDCEAMTILGDTLYLFTKDWVKGETYLVPVPAQPGNHGAKVIDTFPADGLVTDAAFLPADSLLVLSGYKDYAPFLLLFKAFEAPRFFDGRVTRVDMPDIFRVQTEGVFLKNRDSLFISSEATDLPPQLYLLTLKTFLERN